MKAGTVKSNSIVLIGGRIILSAGRLLVVIILVRMSGTETFGGYALILSLVAFFDWLVDFGQTDIAVREIASDGNKRAAWLGALGRNKLIMGLLGGALVPILSILLGYSEEIIAGAFVGGFAVMLHALLQVPRTILKLEMRQDRDILGEVAGLVTMLITLSIAARAGASLPQLMATFVIARVVHLLGMLSSSRVRQTIMLSLWQGSGQQKALSFGAIPLGTAGMLAVLYESLAPILLSKLHGLEAVTIFSTATRFAMPVLIVTQALNSAFFPALARSWEDGIEAFSHLQQSALTVTTAIAAVMFTGLFCGAEFLMKLIDPDLVQHAIVIKVMALVVLARAVTAIMTPVVVLSRRQNIALAFTVTSLLTQLLLQVYLVPRFGALGAASSYLIAEPLLGTLAVSLLSVFLAKVRLNWSHVLMTYAIAMIVVGCLTLTQTPSFASMLLAPCLALALLIAFRIVPFKPLGIQLNSFRQAAWDDDL